MTKRFASALLVAFCIASLHTLINAQSPHGGAGVKLQPGPNVNAAGGIVNPGDPAALVKSDILLQRQNETVVAASTRNPDHILAAANDYRFVDFPDDPSFGGVPSFITRLIAKLFRRPLAKPLPARATASVGAWTGVYRSCDRGRTWIGSALPGGPLDTSPASLASPLKALSDYAETLVNAHAETTDPFLVAGPGGRVHMVVLGFIRHDTGAITDSRMYYSSYTDLNNLEGGSCFKHDFTQEIDKAENYGSAALIDKPSMAVDKDGAIFISYTVFTDSLNSKVVIARKLPDASNWTTTIPQYNLGFLRNHGTTTTVDKNGRVYVAWRLFYDDWPLMVVSRSIDRGQTFSYATPISEWWPEKNIGQIVQQLKAAKLRPFDQFNETPGGDPAKATARALAFPSIAAGVVNGESRLFAVWQERADVRVGSKTFGYPSSTGSPRIMFTMSTDGGWSWTPRRAIDAGPRPNYQLPQDPARPSGPQVQPALSISGTTNPQLLVVYYEAREELAKPYGSNFISGIERQMDVRSARIDPVTGVLVAPSVQVAEYSIKTNSLPAALAETAPGFAAVMRSNLWMYGGGTKAFFGDYPHVAPSTVFEFDTQSSSWNWASEPGSALAIWTDHRDVQFPINGIAGSWNDYTPLNKPLPAGSCSHVALRNANPYFTEIAGVVAGSPQNFKKLNIERAFVTYVENRTPLDRFFRLTILTDGVVVASFKQFVPETVSDVQIFGYSSHTQSIWVKENPENETAQVRMKVEEIDPQNGQVVPSGYSTSVTLNPDPNNEALTPVPAAAPVPPGTSTDIEDSELHNPQVSAPQVSAFNIKAPQVSAPQVSAPQVSAPQVSAPQVSAPQVSAPQVSAPQVSATTPDDGNEGTDVTYTVTNTGNTESTYNAFLDVPNVTKMLDDGNYDFQVLITRTSLVPGFWQKTPTECVPAAETKVQVIANLQIPTATATQFQAISGSQSSLATFSVAPAGGADVAASSTDGQSTALRDEVKVTLRAIRLKPINEIPIEDRFTPDAVVLTVASTSTNVLDGVVQEDGTQPVGTASTTTLVSSAPLAIFGSQLTLTATVSPDPPNTDEATVQFFDGNTLLGSAPVDDGEATFTTSALSFAPHSLSAYFVGSPSVAPSTSAVITQHLVRRYDTLNAYVNEVIGDVFAENFNGFDTGTPLSAINPIGGILNVTSTFDTLEVFSGGTAFGHDGTTRLPGGTSGRYDLLFAVPSEALAFDIVAQDPATSPAQIEILTSVGSAFFDATNPGPETANVFHGFDATLPLLGARVYEGCEVNEVVGPTCGNEEIALDNLMGGRDVREWSTAVGGNGSFYEYVRVGGLSWTEANTAAQARTFLGRTGHLVSITSAAENSFVDSLRDEGPLRAWIGLSDPDGTGPGAWVWTTGEPTSYFNWVIGEPNNPETEFWVEMFGGGQWNNNIVQDTVFPTLGYIVEYPPPIIIGNNATDPAVGQLFSSPIRGQIVTVGGKKVSSPRQPNVAAFRKTGVSTLLFGTQPQQN